MNYQVLYCLVLFAAAVVLATLGAYAWRRRSNEHARRLASFCVLALAWVVLVGAMALSSPALARTWLSVKYLFIGLTPVATFVFVRGHTRAHSLRSWQISALCVIPVAGHLASWSDAGGMVRQVVFARDHDLTFAPTMHFGPMYWVFTSYLYALIAWSAATLAIEWRSGSRLARRQAAALLVGVLTPLVANVLLISEIAPRAYDPMPVGLGVSGLALWWGAFRHGMLDLVPVARNVLVDTLRDGVLIVDKDGRLVDANLSMARIADRPLDDWIGRDLDEHWDVPQPMRQAVLAAVASPDAATPLQLAGQTYDVHAVVVPDAGEPSRARVVVVRDVSEREALQQAQAQLIGELTQALAEVRTLRGLLPICAGCKQIRDEAGAWQPIEGYIGSRTEATFSHGMCPTCLARWRAELLAEGGIDAIDGSEPG